MPSTIFYSWQSDIKAAACRSIIGQALERAVASLAKDAAYGVEPAVDRDTLGVPGSPDIGAVIFSKIDVASAFVADVTIVGRTEAGKATPNPNVLVELGYALKCLSWTRVVMVQNTAFGGPENLPFDLSKKRVLTYHSAPDAEERATERRLLESKLEQALREIVKEPTNASAPVQISLNYEKKQISSEIHQYELAAIIKNTGSKRIDDWEVEIEFPTPLVEPGVTFGSQVRERSNAEWSLFRADGRKKGKPLYPGDGERVTLGYRVDNAIYRRRDELFALMAKARASVNGEIVARTERPIRELQCF